jgi:hypothetical protein
VSGGPEPPPGPPGRFPQDRKQLGLGLGVTALLVANAWGIHTGRIGVGADAAYVFFVLTPLAPYLLLKGAFGFDLAVALGLGKVVERLRRL